MKQRGIGILLALTLLCGWIPANAANTGTGLGQSFGAAGLRAYQSRYDRFTQCSLPDAENQKMVQAARAQLGRSGSSLNYSEAWCADFVMDIARMAGISSDIIPWDYTNGAVVQYFEERMTKVCGAQTVDPRGARPGDIIIFDWNNNGWSDHVAIVEWYDKERDEIITIGGDQDGGNAPYQRLVSEEFWKAGSKSIHQVLRPDYQSRDDSELVHAVHVDVTVLGSGTVNNQNAYQLGEEVTLTAKPAPGNAFVGWYQQGECVSTSPEYSLTVPKRLELTAKFAAYRTITAEASRSGSAAGSGSFLEETKVTLTALETGGAAFAGWYLQDGTLLTRDAVLEVTVDYDRTYYAMFEGDVFYDVKEDSWFKDDVLRAVELGIVKGYSAVRFGGELAYTRAMMVEMLSRLEQADTAAAPVCQFVDVDQNIWYAKAVNWAAAEGVVKGTDATHFEPEEPITREHFMMMVVRYLEKKGYGIKAARLPYTDVSEITDAEAEGLITKAQTAGLLEGYEDGTLRPQQKLYRHEGVTILMRAVRYLEKHPLPGAQKPNKPEPDTPAPETPDTPGTDVPEEPGPAEPSQEPEPEPEQPAEAAG